MTDFLTALLSFIDAKQSLRDLQHLDAQHRRAFNALGGPELLDKTLESVIAAQRDLDLAWQGIAERVDDDGNIVDGCTGTGLQESLKDYLHRPAIFGFDHRSGSLGLWFATEMARLDAGAS